MLMLHVIYIICICICRIVERGQIEAAKESLQIQAAIERSLLEDVHRGPRLGDLDDSDDFLLALSLSASLAATGEQAHSGSGTDACVNTSTMDQLSKSAPSFKTVMQVSSLIYSSSFEISWVFIHIRLFVCIYRWVETFPVSRPRPPTRRRVCCWHPPRPQPARWVRPPVSGARAESVVNLSSAAEPRGLCLAVHQCLPFPLPLRLHLPPPLPSRSINRQERKVLLLVLVPPSQYPLRPLVRKE